MYVEIPADLQAAGVTPVDAHRIGAETLLTSGARPQSAAQAAGLVTRSVGPVRIALGKVAAVQGARVRAEAVEFGWLQLSGDRTRRSARRRAPTRESEVVWQNTKGLVWCQRSDRAEVAPVQGQYRVRTIVSRQRDIDRVGQVKIQVRVLPLHLASKLQRIGADLGHLETHAQGLGDDVVEDRVPSLGAESDLGQVVHLSKHERGYDHGTGTAQQVSASTRLRRAAIRGRNYAGRVRDDDHPE